MSIVITTSDSEQQFSTREEVKFDAVQPTQTDEVEKKTDVSATEEEGEANKEGKTEDKSFDYLNQGDEEEEVESDLDDDDDETETETDTEKGEPKKSGFKKRIDKLTRRNSEQEFRIAQLEYQIQNGITNKQEQQEQKVPKVEEIEEIAEPNIDDFEEYSEYIKQLTKYQVNEERKAHNLQVHEAAVRKEADEITKKYRDRLEEAKKRYGEKQWNALSKSEIPMSITMRSEIMQSEVGPDILFFLHHNEEEAKRINNLTPLGQVKELTKLEIKVSNKLADKNGKPKTEASGSISKAPAPIKPIDSKTDGKTIRDPNKMTFNEYKAWRFNKK